MTTKSFYPHLSYDLFEAELPRDDEGDDGLIHAWLKTHDTAPGGPLDFPLSSVHELWQRIRGAASRDGSAQRRDLQLARQLLKTLISKVSTPGPSDAAWEALKISAFFASHAVMSQLGCEATGGLTVVAPKQFLDTCLETLLECCELQGSSFQGIAPGRECRALDKVRHCDSSGQCAPDLICAFHLCSASSLQGP